MTLLVVDTQKLITNEKLYKYDLFLQNIKALIHSARENGVDVVYIRHDDGKDQPLTKGNVGFDICDEFAPYKGEMIFDKTVNSPFRDSGLLEYLKNKDERIVIVIGLQTEYCIDATVKCGFEHGFEVIVPQYANSTFDNDFMSAEKAYDYYNSFIWNNRYAKSISVADTIELMKRR